MVSSLHNPRLNRASLYSLMALGIVVGLMAIACLITLAVNTAPVYGQDSTPGPSGLFRRNKTTVPAAVAPVVNTTQEKASNKDFVGIKFEDSTKVSQVDAAEVVRRGNRVVKAGSGPMATSDALMSDATSPPPDDSHKWYFTIVVDDSPESKALLQDLKTSYKLRAWIDLDEPKQSWSHATVYTKDDPTQSWRWKDIRISKYPVMILQPPAKLRSESQPDSWEWGNPKTVVWQWDGYEITAKDRDTVRSNAIRNSLKLYVEKLSSSRQFQRSVGFQKSVPPPTPGPRQELGASPPFSFPQVPSPPPSPSQPQFPVFPSDPTPAPSQNPVSLGSLLSILLGSLLGGTGTTNLLLLVLALIQIYRSYRQTKGLPVLLNDDAFSALVTSLKSVLSPNPPKNP